MATPPPLQEQVNLEGHLEKSRRFQQLIREQLALVDGWQRYQKKFSIALQKNAAAIAK